MNAQQLHERGFHVFPADHPDQPRCIGLHGPGNPCDGNRGKHPAVKWGTWAVTVTSKMIDLEWKKYSGLANTAISCGPSNLVVFDEDQAGEHKKWCVTYGVTLPDTYTVSTGRGHHYYYRWNHGAQRIGNSDKAVDGFKMDIRGDGGYVIAEGSQHADGTIYTGDGKPVAELPEQVAKVLIAAADKPSGPEPGQPWEIAAAGGDPNAAKIGFGDRHHSLVAYAGRLRKAGLDRHEAVAVFHARWLLCEQPVGQIPEARFHSPDCRYPVTWEEAEAKLEDVFGRYPAGQTLDAGTACGKAADLKTGDPVGPGRRLVVTRGSQVKAKKMVWWEPGLVLRGAINLLAAREGRGKSTVGSSWAGRETEMGGTVLWIGSEESREHAIVPRLIANGADMDKVIFVDVETDAGTGALVFPLDLAAIEEVIVAHQVTMMFIDPAKGLMPAGFSGNDDIAVRQYLEPIAALAARRNVTIVGLSHFGKRSDNDSGRLLLGSIAWSQVARCVLSIAEDPDTETRVLTNTKANYTSADRSVGFRIVSTEVHTEDGPTEIGKIEWLGDTAVDARDLLGEEGEGDAGERTAAEHWLEDYLTANGPTPSREIKKDASKECISDRTLKRAKKAIGVLDASAGFPRTSTWYLPQQSCLLNPVGPTGGVTQGVGPTGPTGADLHKQDGPTEPRSQSGHAREFGPTDGPTGPIGQSALIDLSPRPAVAAAELATPAAPGAPTPRTPGMTPRVQQILARNHTGHPASHPPCTLCGRPVVAGQGNAHLSCLASEANAKELQP